MRTLGFIVLLVLVTLLVYWQVREHDFVNYDDPVYILDNINIQTGFTLESISWAFSTGYASNWHPLTWLSHIWDYQRFGSNPAGHHLMSMVFHILNSVLMFILLRKLTYSIWQSLFVAALFALHPLHVESVAWASARKDLLSTLLIFLSIYWYSVYAMEKKRLYLVWTSVSFAMSLLAKPVGVTFPFLLLLLDYWPLNRMSYQKESSSEEFQDQGKTAIVPLVIEKVPLFLIAIGSSIVTYLVQRSGGAVSSSTSIPLLDRFANAALAYVIYLRKMFLPVDLAVFYPHTSERISFVMVVGSTVLLLILSLLAWRYRKNLPYLFVGWFWYLGTLIPMIGLVQVGAQAYADRYTYFPLLGIFIIMSWGIADLTARWKFRVPILSISAACLILVLTMLTARQVSFWKNSLTLFEHAIAKTENNWLAHHNLGAALLAQGKLERARSEFMQTMDIQPNLWYTHYSLSQTYKGLGIRDSALIHLTIARRLNPSLSSADVERDSLSVPLQITH
ncbi:MAG: tetratricopeptide repeat protein [bacterium]